MAITERSITKNKDLKHSKPRLRHHTAILYPERKDLAALLGRSKIYARSIVVCENVQLNELEEHGMVEKKIYPQLPPKAMLTSIWL